MKSTPGKGIDLESDPSNNELDISSSLFEAVKSLIISFKSTKLSGVNHSANPKKYAAILSVA